MNLTCNNWSSVIRNESYKNLSSRDRVAISFFHVRNCLTSMVLLVKQNSNKSNQNFRVRIYLKESMKKKNSRTLATIAIDSCLFNFSKLTHELLICHNLRHMQTPKVVEIKFQPQLLIFNSRIVGRRTACNMVKH